MLIASYKQTYTKVARYCLNSSTTFNEVAYLTLVNLP